VYGEGHAYSNPFSGIGSEQTVQSMTVDELRAFYRRWVRPDMRRLLIVGDTTLKQTEPLLEQRLARWQPPAEPLPVKQLASVPMPAKPRIFLVNRTGAEQSLIFAVEVAAATLGSRRHCIRDGEHGARRQLHLAAEYEPAPGQALVLRRRTSLISAKGQRPFVVSAMVQTDKTAESVAETLKELRGLIGARQPTDVEIKAAKDTLVLTLPGSNETSREVATSYGRYPDVRIA